MKNLPLESFKIVDLTQNVAGPFCTQILGDLGADVIKVEPLKGDGTRLWGPPFWGQESVMFLAFNRNKRSLCLDLKSSEGQDILHQLLASADACITAMTPSAALNLGIDSVNLQERHPSLVVCDITAFGSDGPLRDLPGFDPVLQALSGLMSITGEEDGETVRVGTSIVDMGAGMWAAIGILSALLGRYENASLGLSISTSLFETAMAWMPYQSMGYLATSEEPKKWGSELSMLSPYGAYMAADTSVVVAVGNQEIWRRFCVCIEREDLLAASGFRTNAERVENRAAVKREIEAELRSGSAAHWEAKFTAAGVPASRVNTIPEALELDQTVAMGMMQPIDHSSVEGFMTVRSPLTIGGRETRTMAPPLLGEHSQEILAQLGYSDEEILRLRHLGVAP